jgi:aminocarboxymuconate-semialdehyde decarboxylase
MGLIDCHAHCLPKTIMDVLREWAAGTYLGRSLYADEGFNSLERHLVLMDKFGVEKEVINYGNLLVPAAKTGKLPMEEVVRTVNDYIAEACRVAPTRFVPAAAVDPFGGEAALRELDRAVEKLGLFGISLSTNVDGRALDDPVYEPIFERAKRWNMPLWVHPGQVPQAWQQALGLNNRYLNSGVGFLLDDMLCVVKMITAGVFDRWWGVKFVLCQLGGFLPFTMGRFDQQYFFERRAYEQQNKPLPEYVQRRVAEYCQAFYVDTHTADASAIRCALDCMSADRIVLGGDYPISPPEVGLGYTIPQLDKVGLSSADRAKIERENAVRLLNLS